MQAQRLLCHFRTTRWIMEVKRGLARQREVRNTSTESRRGSTSRIGGWTLVSVAYCPLQLLIVQTYHTTGYLLRASKVEYV